MKKQKDLVAVRTDQGPWKIQFEGGGEVPKMLSGIYTKKVIAEAAITQYLECFKRGAKSEEKQKKVQPKETKEKGVEDAKVTPAEH